MKQLAKILGGAYVLGIWIYGVWYLWEHWEGSTNIGTLAGVGFMRAIVGVAPSDAGLTNARGHRLPQHRSP